MTMLVRPTLFLLHGLGGSAHWWDGVVAALGNGFDCVALDLPGFGNRAGDADLSFEAMLDWLAGEVWRRDPDAWMPVGHSMGGKLATLIAARAEAGAPCLSALAGVVLLASSPPAPEPMNEGRRSLMIDWFRDRSPSAEQAGDFVDGNTAARLPEPLRQRVAEGVRRSAREAWLGWLERGSREDWRAAAGQIAAPTLVAAGAEDGDLGEEAQRQLTLPHFADAELAIVAGAKHFLPLEQPEAVAALIAAHWERARMTALPGNFVRLLGSGRVAARTRRVLLERLRPPPATTSALSEGQLNTLRALLDRILPGRTDGVDLAARLDAALAGGEGDGWRFAELPPDAEAWRLGLDTLDSQAGGFAELRPEAQDGWLAGMAEGRVGSDADGCLAPAQMRLWFADVRAEAVRVWLAHPLALARIGYDGFANGGDGERKQGFARTGGDDVEAWQLRPEGGSR